MNNNIEKVISDNSATLQKYTLELLETVKQLELDTNSEGDISYQVEQEINSFLNRYYERYSGLYLKSKDFLKTINKDDEKCKSDLFNQLYFLRFVSHNSEQEV